MDCHYDIDQLLNLYGYNLEHLLTASDIVISDLVDTQWPHKIILPRIIIPIHVYAGCPSEVSIPCADDATMYNGNTSTPSIRSVSFTHDDNEKVDTPTAEPRTQHEAIPVIRRYLLRNEAHKAHELAGKWLQSNRIGGHIVRTIHHNSKNWPLIPYLPAHMKTISHREWGPKLLDALRNKGKFSEYTTWCTIG